MFEARKTTNLIIRMKPTMNLLPTFTQHIPATHALIQATNLVVCPNIMRIFLHGSHRLKDCACPYSDIDLRLLVDLSEGFGVMELERFVQIGSYAR